MRSYLVGGLIAISLVAGVVGAGCKEVDQFDPERAGAKQLGIESREIQQYVGCPVSDVIAKFGEPTRKLPGSDEFETIYVYDANENLTSTPNGTVVVRRAFWVDKSQIVTKTSIAKPGEF